MYRCNECLELFDIPDTYYTSYENYYGVDSLFVNNTPLTLELCPCCGEENIEEIEDNYKPYSKEEMYGVSDRDFL